MEPAPAPLFDHALADATYFERAMGETELSYFLPSRESGVNDMYLHLGFTAPPSLMGRSRLSLIWAVLRARHPLLASRVHMIDYDNVKFRFKPPSSIEEALNDANENLDYRHSSTDELINEYLNGTRTLSNERLSYLIVSESKPAALPTPPSTPSETTAAPLGDYIQISPRNYDILLAAAHFIGDGMALHNFANEFFGLVGNSRLTEEGLQDLLTQELLSRWDQNEQQNLPPAMETGLNIYGGQFYRVASQVDFNLTETKLIGGHSFPRRTGGSVRTVVPTVPINKEKTKTMLKVCKSHGVTISSVMFALCNLAWARACDTQKELPIMLYSAINLRPYISPSPSKHDSFFFLSIGYFNVVLPSFFPVDKDALTRTFWHRAQSAKEQSLKTGKSPLIVPRSRIMATKRAQRAIAWAKEDDARAAGTFQRLAPPTATKPAQPPSTCLTGLSLLGNLDSIYKHSSFPNIKLHTLTTGSRQRPGGMLMFSYTFVGMLWMSLGYDINGFQSDIVEKFWQELLQCVDEFLLD